MKYYILAGEASGDLHGANLMKELYALNPEAEIRFWGGDLMDQVGGTLVKHYRDLAFMGFVEVIQNLGTILKNIKRCKKDITEFQPDALILIDYPGFNLRIAKWATTLNFKIFYYISPQVWAWKSSRVKLIREVIDKMFVILPFEKDFYKEHDYEVEFVGHPLIDAVANYNSPANFHDRWHLDKEKKIIALLPGSRKQEVTKMLNIMLSLVSDYPDYQFVIAGAPTLSKSYYQAIIGRSDNSQKIGFVENDTYALLENSYAALVTSGTATLETALFSVPQVVCYKGNKLSFLIAKQLVKLKYISLVNLIFDQEVVKELIQDDFNSENLSKELNKILESKGNQKMRAKYEELKQLLGSKGASKRTAMFINSELSVKL